MDIKVPYRQLPPSMAGSMQKQCRCEQLHIYFLDYTDGFQMSCNNLSLKKLCVHVKTGREGGGAVGIVSASRALVHF